MAVNLSKYIKSIKVETAYLPTIDIQDPFKPGPPNPFLQYLKPKITIDVDQFGEQTIVPYGDPGETIWPVIKGIFIVAGLVFIANKLIK